MENPDINRLRIDTAGSRIVGMLFRFWHGHSQEVEQQFEYWNSMNKLLEIGGKVHDHAWIINRQTELMTSLASLSTTTDSSDLHVLAYGRARLEDFCRHQATLPDGRVVTRLPAYGADREKLAQLGITTDTFIREATHESSDDNRIAVLPAGWTMRPADTISGTDTADPLANTSWAGIYNEANTQLVSVFYSHKPLPFEDDFRSYTHVPDTAAL